MKLLILGGTVFLGRHLVESALTRGHEVSLFNRGLHNPELFPQVDKLRGDRDGALDALVGRRWDAVIDTSGYVPRLVGASARLLATAVARHVFISTISVYADFSRPGLKESAPVATLADAATETVDGRTYGPLKALCEQEVERELPERALTIRPGLIVGPHDPSDRFTYWPHRIAQGGRFLAPGGPEDTVRFIDGRDLADWTVAMVEQRQTGLYHVTGPESPLPFGTLVDVCREVSGSDATPVWVDDAFLLDAGVAPYTELPLWIPKTPATRGSSAIDCSRAFGAGLRVRPLAETVRDTLHWDAGRPLQEARSNGLPRARERELLEAWSGISA